MERDPLLSRALELLYADWFEPLHGESLRPRSMWLVEYEHRLGHLDMLDWRQPAKRVFYLRQIGMETRVLADWERFKRVQLEQVWHWHSEMATGVFDRVPPGKYVRDVGWAFFARDPDTGQSTYEFYFGPSYARGYAENAQGNPLPGWKS